jgi:hypothetical protein
VSVTSAATRPRQLAGRFASFTGTRLTRTRAALVPGQVQCPSESVDKPAGAGREEKEVKKAEPGRCDTVVDPYRQSRRAPGQQRRRQECEGQNNERNGEGRGFLRSRRLPKSGPGVVDEPVRCQQDCLKYEYKNNDASDHFLEGARHIR